MAKPTRKRRRRAASGEPRLTSPLPSAPPLECDVDGEVGVCTYTHHVHRSTTPHVDNVVEYISWAFHVIGARRLITRYGIDLVSDVALELEEAVRLGAMAKITNPAGFFVWSVKDRAESGPEMVRQELRAVDDEDQAAGG